MKDPSWKTHEVSTVSLYIISQSVAAHLNEMLWSSVFHTSTDFKETALCISL